MIVSTWTVALIPFMAQRAATDPPPEDAQDLSTQDPTDTPLWQRALGAFSGAVGAFSLAWFALGRPEYGDLAQRLSFFHDRMLDERLFGVYVMDLGIYWAAQWVIMRGAGASQKYSALPFFGLCAWTAAGKPRR